MDPETTPTEPDQPKLEDLDLESDPWAILQVPQAEREAWLRDQEAQLPGASPGQGEPDEAAAAGDPAAPSPPPEAAAAPVEGDSPPAGASPLEAQLATERQRNEAFSNALLGLAQVQAQAQAQATTPPAPEVPAFDENPEAHFKATLDQRISEVVAPLHQQNQELRSALEQLATNQHLTTSEQFAKAQFPDYDQVVTPDILREVQGNPQLAAAFRATQQPMTELYRWALGRKSQDRITQAETDARRAILGQLRKSVESPAGAKPALAGTGGAAATDATSGLDALSSWDFLDRYKSLKPTQKSALLRQEG